MKDFDGEELGNCEAAIYQMAVDVVEDNTKRRLLRYLDLDVLDDDTRLDDTFSDTIIEVTYDSIDED
jgi:hypothetical protein